MTTRITRKDLDRLCELLNKMMPEADFSIGGAYGGWRLERNHESVDVSPRLSKPELYQWMHAFLDGFEFASR